MVYMLRAVVMVGTVNDQGGWFEVEDSRYVRALVIIMGISYDSIFSGTEDTCWLGLKPVVLSAEACSPQKAGSTANSLQAGGRSVGVDLARRQLNLRLEGFIKGGDSFASKPKDFSQVGCDIDTSAASGKPCDHESQHNVPGSSLRAKHTTSQEHCSEFQGTYDGLLKIMSRASRAWNSVRSTLPGPQKYVTYWSKTIAQKAIILHTLRVPGRPPSSPSSG